MGVRSRGNVFYAVCIVIMIIVLMSGSEHKYSNYYNTERYSSNCGVRLGNSESYCSDADSYYKLSYSNVVDTGNIIISNISSYNEIVGIEFKSNKSVCEAVDNRQLYEVYKGKAYSIPMYAGNGKYRIDINVNEHGSVYRAVKKFEIYVVMKDVYSPFLHSNSIVEYGSGMSEFSDLVNKFKSCDFGKSDKEKTDSVFEYISKNITYNDELAKEVSDNKIKMYKSNVENTVEKRCGICLDYSCLMASILRCEGIPVKLDTGYNGNGVYHAWNEVYFDGDWHLYDSTLGIKYSCTESNGYVADKWS